MHCGYRARTVVPPGSKTMQDWPRPADRWPQRCSATSECGDLEWLWLYRSLVLPECKRQDV